MTPVAGSYRRGWRLFVVMTALAMPMMATSCYHSAVHCDYPRIADTITGQLVARHGAEATFIIDSVVPESPLLSGARGYVPPVLAIGQHVTVRYDDNEARFLHVGSRYRARLWWTGEFTSGVHTAHIMCSTGTVYANGSAINPSWWQHWNRTVVYGSGIS